MAGITEKCKEILEELDKNIKDPSSLEFAKTGVYNLLEAFLQEIETIQETAEKRIEKLVQNQINLDKRISTIESDIYEEEDEEVEIVCPYCNHEFIVEAEEMKEELICPECNNAIELDWGEEHNCSCCDGDCEDDCHCDDCEDDCDCYDYEEDDEDDDM